MQNPLVKFLPAILDPNADIRPGWRGHAFTLAAGEQLFGLVSSKTSSSVTLKLPDACLRTLTHSELQSLRSQNAPRGSAAAATILQQIYCADFSRKNTRKTGMSAALISAGTSQMEFHW